MLTPAEAAAAAQTGPPAEVPWLTPQALTVQEALERGHRQAFGSGLLGGGADRPWRLWAQELFVASEVVLAHDGSSDPRLIYANRSALRLWRRAWGELVGMPSRLTAEPQERRARSAALSKAEHGGGLRGYGGVRIDSQGRRFQLRGARIWSLITADGRRCGQAAAFEDWWWL